MTLQNCRRPLPAAALLGAVLLFSGAAQAAGLLVPRDGSLPALEIRDHDVGVVIEDGYAITTVEQVFHNPHARDLEAIYSFPVPRHGSVGEFTLWIDGKPITGEVLEKRKAREVYETEKAAGRDAGLTEKDEYRTFEVAVSPVRAGQDTRVRIVYLQPAFVDTGIGRYVYPLEEGGVDDRKLAFWTANEQVTRQFNFELRIRSAYPVDAVRVPGRPGAAVTRHGDGDWSVKLDANTQARASSSDDTDAAPTPVSLPASFDSGNAQNSAAFVLDKDLVIYWRHKPGLPGSVDLVAYRPDAGKRGTFMLTLTPGDDLKPITEGKDWVFVLDISGSMQGKYATLADGVQRALSKLRPADRFHIVLFNTSARTLISGFVNATPEVVQRYSEEVARISPNNGTNLYEGLNLGLRAIDADRTSGVVLVTDGVANVGEIRQRKFIELARKNDVRLFTFIMGNSANRPLLENLTRESGGFAVNISNSDDIVGQLLSATSKLGHEAFHAATLKIGGVKTTDVVPENIGSLYRGQQLVVFGHYFGDGVAEVRLAGKVSGQPIEYRTEFEFPATATRNPEIERLWAYSHIQHLKTEIEDFGENPDIKQAIVDLGVEYGLVTDYTSMVVVRDEVFDRLGIDRTNTKRLAVEKAAQQQRATQAVVQNRVDKNKPMFNSNRPSYSGSRGGGALGPWTILVLLPLVWLVVAGRRREAVINGD
jgi:Ca-activated chloride channel family protein